MSDGNGSTTRNRSLWPLAIGLATFLLHALIAWRFPLPGIFRKYALAAEQLLAGELPQERLMDFSPLYFHLSLAAERLLPQPEPSAVGVRKEKRIYNRGQNGSQ